MLETILAACQPDTLVTVACDLTLTTEYIITKTVETWRKSLPELNKRPCVFLLWRS